MVHNRVQSFSIPRCNHASDHRVYRIHKRAVESALATAYSLHRVSGSQIASIANQISVLQRGAVLAEGTYDEVSNNPLVLEAYMGTVEVS